MLLNRAGRQLIYELSAKHHNCLLLNYAIQKILRQGHEDEVASIGSSLASYFGVFHRLLAARLKEVPSASPARLRQLSTELKVALLCPRDLSSGSILLAAPHQSKLGFAQPR